MIVYDVTTGAHKKISETGEKPRWLSDSRRLLYTDHGALHLMDTQDEEYRARSTDPRSAPSSIRPFLTTTGLIYYIHRRDEGNIWLATVK